MGVEEDRSSISVRGWHTYLRKKTHRVQVKMSFEDAVCLGYFLKADPTLKMKLGKDYIREKGRVVYCPSLYYMQLILFAVEEISKICNLIN